MSELDIFLFAGCTLLCAMNIALSVRDIVRYEMRSLFAGMLLIYLPIILYGLYWLPFMDMRGLHEQKFSYEVLNREYFGFLILNAAVAIIFVIRAICMRGVNLNVPSHLRPKAILFNSCFYFTIFYSCIFILMKRGRLLDLVGFILDGDYAGYYLYRKELIYEKLTTGIIINNLDSTFVYGMLYFFVGLFAWEFFKTRRLDWRLAVTVPLVLLTALLRFQKAPLIVALCVVVLAWIYSRRFNSKIFTSLLKGICGGVVVFGFASVILSVLGSEGSIFQTLHDRILLTPAYTSYGFYWTFPDHHDFLHFNGSRTFNLIFGFGQQTHLLNELNTAPLIVSRLYYGVTTFFNFNTNILGESYAQNGYWGIVQGVFVLFGVFALWDYVFLKKSPTRPDPPVLIFCLCQFMVVLNAGMFSVISAGFLLVPMVYVMTTRR